ncbi:MAG: TAXI family TRAP transporter solute-binding subunit [Peptococcaceae bacterium]|nr:TAXI family TRAP transporter solute-binding subunit [Peptococcaceae bacterium]
MKKAIYLKALCLILVLIFALGGCGGNNAQNSGGESTQGGGESEGETPSGDPVYLNMGTGSSGGVFYTFGIGVGTLVGEKTNMQFTVEATKASVENLNLLDSGDIEVATVSFPSSLKAYKGDEPFTKAVDERVLFQMYDNPVHVIVMADSPYYTMEDLKDKKISIGQPGSGNAQVCYAFLEGLLGWVDGVDYTGEYLTYTESVEAFKAGQIDAAIFDTVNPHATIIDLASWKPIRLIPVDTTLIDNSTDEYAKEFFPVTIPGGTYKGQDEDVVTVGHGNYMVCRADWDENLAYTFVKTVFENLDYMKNVHAAADRLTPENGCNGGGVPIHPGALKYFQEVGVDTAGK